MVPRAATNLTLKKVKSQGQGHDMVPIERVCRKDHACKKYQYAIFNISEDMSKVKVFVTDGRTDRETDGQTDE